MVYYGSRIFLPLSEKIGLPLDQFNFMLCELTSLLLGLLFRAFLKPCPQNTQKRHVVALVFGMLIASFCFGEQMWYLLAHSLVAYILILFVSRKYVHLVIFTFSMGTLSFLHIYRIIYHYGKFELDVAGPLMVHVQKITALAFAYYDGQRRIESLSEDQKQQAIRQRPSTIEYFSYMFNFQSVIVGPLSFYQDYIDFITGNNFLKHKKNSELASKDEIGQQPDNKVTMLKKFAMIVIFGVLFFKLSTVYTMRGNLDINILNKPFHVRLLYMWFAGVMARMKYYLAWTLAELVCNASGFGFNGYDKNNKEKWNLLTNVNVWEHETATSMKVVFDTWNIQTQLWLRRICFDRIPILKTIAVFFLSAVWHGFYPGYYFCGITFALAVYAGRGIRRKIRPLFQVNSTTKLVYAAITFVGTSLLSSYGVTSFELCEFKLCVQFYNSLYWCFTIFIILTTILLPGGSKKAKDGSQGSKNDSKVVNNEEKKE